MAQRLILLLPLTLLLCAVQVLADSKNEEYPGYPFSQSLKVKHQDSLVFPNGASRNLMQDIVKGLSKYLSNGHNNHAVNTGPVPAPGPKNNPLAPAPAPSNHLDCDGLCKHRCSLHSRPNICWRACGTCCLRCKCVPPGTFGNRELCGTCYTNMTTHGNKPKCP